MPLDETRRTSFDRNAEQYDAVRPSYPDALVDDVLARTGARRILEVGAGTGKATVLFARRGCSITALEPGAQMAAVLRRTTAGLDVTVESSKFEDWSGGPYDLVLAAQSFHWVEPEHRYVKAAAALRPGGSLALLTNEKAALEPALRDELDAAYTRWKPDPEPHAIRDAIERARRRWTGELEASGLFGPVHVGLFPWHATYTTHAYLELLDTYSDHAVLPAATKQSLYADLTTAIERHGGRIDIPYVAMAIVAARR